MRSFLYELVIFLINKSDVYMKYICYTVSYMYNNNNGENRKYNMQG